jgi:hypothetical protein
MIWTTEISLKTTAKKEQIWKIWSDVSNWNVWDKEVETSKIYGQFQAGTLGIVKSVGGPKVKFQITELYYLSSFTSRSFLPFCKMDFIHLINETNNGLEITHKIQMSGLTTFIFSKAIGNKLKVGLPKAIEELINLVEKN